LVAGAVLGAFEVEVFEKVGDAAGVFGFVAAAALDEDGEAGWGGGYLAMRECMDSEATVMPFEVLERSGWGRGYGRGGSS
jgi:hypothetical protein